MPDDNNDNKGGTVGNMRQFIYEILDFGGSSPLSSLSVTLWIMGRPSSCVHWIQVQWCGLSIGMQCPSPLYRLMSGQSTM